MQVRITDRNILNWLKKAQKELESDHHVRLSMAQVVELTLSRLLTQAAMRKAAQDGPMPPNGVKVKLDVPGL